MKKVLFLLVSLLLIVSFCACDDDDKDYESPPVTYNSRIGFWLNGYYAEFQIDGKNINVDWGDGSATSSVGSADSEDQYNDFSHNYSYRTQNPVVIKAEKIRKFSLSGATYSSFYLNGCTDIIELKLKNVDNVSFYMKECPNLEVLHIGNKLSLLDVTKNIKLTELRFSKNNISSIDLSENIELTILECNNNKLKSLDISNNKKLDYVACQGNLLDEIALNSLFSQLPATGGEIYIKGNPGVETCDVSIAEDKGWEVIK
ncbi:MAG: hypothetical protein LBV43_04945 [Prevotella sp.]|jgi:hypothetical protein|nr:hypothetical protein [Prevotella sp.]